MTPPLTLAVAGAKGGVGKTTTSINLAKALADEGRETLIVELDLAMANMVDFLSLPDDPEPTLHEVLSGEAEPMDAVYEVGPNTSVAPSGTSLDGYADTDLDRFPPTLERFREAYDLVVVDTGAGLNRSVVEPIRHADATVVVSTPRVASVRDAKKTIALSERVETPVAGLVLTQSGTGASPGPETIAEFLDVDLLGHIPDDDAVPASQDKGTPVVEWAPKSSAGITYRETAENLLAELPGTDATNLEWGREATDREAHADERRETEVPASSAGGGETTEPAGRARNAGATGTAGDESAAEEQAQPEPTAGTPPEADPGEQASDGGETDAEMSQPAPDQDPEEAAGVASATSGSDTDPIPGSGSETTEPPTDEEPEASEDDPATETQDSVDMDSTTDASEPAAPDGREAEPTAGGVGTARERAEADMSRSGGTDETGQGDAETERDDAATEPSPEQEPGIRTTPENTESDTLQETKNGATPEQDERTGDDETGEESESGTSLMGRIRSLLG